MYDAHIAFDFLKRALNEINLNLAILGESMKSEQIILVFSTLKWPFSLCYACELDVDEVIDIATLTGACVVALGSAASGIMGNHQPTIDKLIKCANSGGEKMWQLPMFDEYKESLQSDVADMRNTGSRMGGAQIAGIFLQNFVKKVHWAHIDVAGTAFLDKPQNEFPKGATGAGVRTLINYLML